MTFARDMANRWTNLQRAQDGSIMPMIAMSLTAIIALGSAALALAMDGRAANTIQSTADFAALSGASAFVAASSPRLEDRVADAESAVAASVNANADYIVRKLDVSSIVEDAYGQHAKIEVSLGFQPTNPAARIAGRNAGIEINRTATASATWGFPLCVLGLTSSGTGFGLQQQASLSAKNCVVWTNATSGTSMKLNGGSAEAKQFCAAGGASTSGAKVVPAPYEDCDPIPDPLASWTAPGPGAVLPLPLSKHAKSYELRKLLDELTMVLDHPDLKDATKAIRDALRLDESLPESAVTIFAQALDPVSGLFEGLKADKALDENGIFLKGEAKGLHVLEVAQILGIIDNLPADLFPGDSYTATPGLTVLPGTYAGMDIASGHVRLMPGIYHIVGAPLTVRRKATLTAEGVTFVLHGDDATISVLDQARATLIAPEDGPAAGFAIAENRRAALSGKKAERSRFTGSGRVNMIGTLYLPRQQLSITGKGAAEQTSPLLQIVADNLDMADQGSLKINFDPAMTRVPVTIKAAREARLEH